MKINYSLVDEILEAIFPLPAQFGIDTDTEELYWLDDMKEIVEDIDSDSEFYFGMSKMVIVPSEEDFVIKIPFNGYYYGGWDDNDEYENMWHDFSNAPGSKSSDYCFSEFEKYLALKRKGLGFFVAKTIFYKTISNINIYLQEKVIPFSDYVFSNPSHEITKQSERIAQGMLMSEQLSTSRIHPTWLATCIDKYGLNKVNKFLNYCAAVDNDLLADLHRSNYGYRKNNMPALLDFSNFCD